MRYLLAILIALPALADDWFVDLAQTGSSANTGVSWANAWTNLSSIDWSTGVDAGDRVFIQGDNGAGGTNDYAATLTVGDSGTSGNWITICGTNSPGLRRVLVSSRNYIKVLSLEIFQVSPGSGERGIQVNGGSHHVLIADNYIHHSGTSGIEVDPSSYDVEMRDNIVVYAGCLSGEATQGAAALQIHCLRPVIQYNLIGHSGDYLVLEGCTNWIVRNNYAVSTSTNDWPEYGGEGHHVDFPQWSANGSTTLLYDGTFEANYQYSNNVPHGHGFLFQNAEGGPVDARFAVFKRNVWDLIGSGSSFNPFTDGAMLNNNLIRGQQQDGTGNADSFAFGDRPNGVQFCTNGVFVGNIGYNAANNIANNWVEYESSGTTNGAWADYNIRYLSGDPALAWVDANGWELDPQFVDYANQDYHLTSGSTAVDAMPTLTTANGAGSGSTSLTVHSNSYWFTPLLSAATVIDGDWITIGSGDPVMITARNPVTHAITLATARTWSDNDVVKPATPLAALDDVGAYEYRADGYVETVEYVDNGDGTALLGADPGIWRMAINYTGNLPGTTTYLTNALSTTVTFNTGDTLRVYPRFAHKSASESTMLYTLASQAGDAVAIGRSGSVAPVFAAPF